MDTIKDILKICNEALWYDYRNQRNVCEFIRLRKYLIQFFL